LKVRAAEASDQSGMTVSYPAKLVDLRSGDLRCELPDGMNL